MGVDLRQQSAFRRREVDFFGRVGFSDALSLHVFLGRMCWHFSIDVLNFATAVHFGLGAFWSAFE